MLKPARIVPYLDGIRGIAAFLVFMHHYLLAFYPAYHTFDIATTNLNGLDIRFGRNVASVFTNGNYFVHVFFVLSGFVLSRSYFVTGDINVPVGAFYRRFLRLYIPVAFSLLLAYALIKCRLFFNVEVANITHCGWWLGSMWQMQDPEGQLYNCLLFETMFNGNNAFDTSMWTISYEFYGSLLVFVSLVFGHFTRYRVIIVLAQLAYFYMVGQTLYGCFMLGVTLCYTENGRLIKSRYAPYAAFVLLPLALVLGSYPSNGNMEGTLFAEIGHSLWALKHWYHAIGAYLLVLSFMFSPALQRLGSLRIFRFLGYVSFSLYLLHALVIGSAGCWLFLRLYPVTGYHYAVAIVFVAVVVITCFLSWLATRYIDGPGIRLAYRLSRALVPPPRRAQGKESVCPAGRGNKLQNEHISNRN